MFSHSLYSATDEELLSANLAHLSGVLEPGLKVFLGVLAEFDFDFVTRNRSGIVVGAEARAVWCDDVSADAQEPLVVVEVVFVRRCDETRKKILQTHPYGGWLLDLKRKWNEFFFFFSNILKAPWGLLLDFCAAFKYTTTFATSANKEEHSKVF